MDIPTAPQQMHVVILRPRGHAIGHDILEPVHAILVAHRSTRGSADDGPAIVRGRGTLAVEAGLARGGVGGVFDDGAVAGDLLAGLVHRVVAVADVRRAPADLSAALVLEAGVGGGGAAAGENEVVELSRDGGREGGDEEEEEGGEEESEGGGGKGGGCRRVHGERLGYGGFDGWIWIGGCNEASSDANDNELFFFTDYRRRSLD